MRVTKPFIRRPCGEDENKMTSVEGGLHCERCNHIVIDFRHWSDQEIASFLQHHSENKTCGIFHHEQLNQKTTLREAVMKPFRFAAAAAIAFFASSLEVSAQAKQLDATTVSTNAISDSVVWRISGHVHARHKKESGEKIDKDLTGIVVRVFGANGEILGETRTSNGKFEVILATAPDTRMDIVFSGIRYHEYRIRQFNPEGQPALDVKLRPLNRFKTLHENRHRVIGCPSF